MEMLNIKETGLNNLIKKGYNLLSLETFLHLVQRSLGHGLLPQIVPLQKQQEKYIQTLKKVLLEQKLFLMTILSAARVG